MCSKRSCPWRTFESFSSANAAAWVMMCTDSSAHVIPLICKLLALCFQVQLKVLDNLYIPTWYEARLFEGLTLPNYTYLSHQDQQKRHDMGSIYKEMPSDRSQEGSLYLFTAPTISNIFSPQRSDWLQPCWPSQKGLKTWLFPSGLGIRYCNGGAKLIKLLLLT